MNKIDKELERQRKIDETREKLEDLVAKHEENAKKFLALVIEAKLDNRVNDYNQTLKYYDYALKRKAKAKSMLHQFKLIELIRDDAAASKAFADSIVMISKETSKLFKDSSMRKAMKELYKVKDTDEKSNMLMDAFMDTVPDFMGDIDSMPAEQGIDKETIAQVDAEVARVKSSIETTSDDRLKELLGK